ncbi:MAG TPA: GTPase ObgE [Solirubrobacteraceae bacterium]|jgi:GTP-binding protein|nr:GTPase ObgE [Solirubrobacteraceae bacterium]
MLDDRARIEVRAGAGGDGSAGFRREAHVPRGGPDGGDGGRGGDVVLVCDDSLRDLQSFRRTPHYRAGRGGHGEGSQRHGADGQTLLVRVPPGTQVEGVEGDVAGRRWDLLAAGQRALVAKGGSGGRGNKRFATPTRQAPRFAERGLVGEEGWLQLQLKLLADVGLVGLPNAGKSSLLARLTRATPKVASYPFTTLSPVLGVLEADERQLVIADIPGLIEGASEGAGLGHDFLAHVERTRLLVHVLDLAPELSGEEQADALANHATIEHELASHDERLARLPRVLALSKADLVPPQRVSEEVSRWSERLGAEVPVIATSSATGAGLGELAVELLRLVPAIDQAGQRTERGVGFGSATGSVAEADQSGSFSASAQPVSGIEPALAEHMVFRPAASTGFVVERIGPDAFAVKGRGIERLVARYDVENEDAMAYLEGRLRKIGVLRALEAEGFQPGDDLEIAGVMFELDPDEST